LSSLSVNWEEQYINTIWSLMSYYSVALKKNRLDGDDTAYDAWIQ